MQLAAEFTAWSSLLGKWWLGDINSGTFGGVNLFASQHDADLSWETALLRGMFADVTLTDVTVREDVVLDAPTAMTARHRIRRSRRSRRTGAVVGVHDEDGPETPRTGISFHGTRTLIRPRPTRRM